MILIESLALFRFRHYLTPARIAISSTSAPFDHDSIVPLRCSVKDLRETSCHRVTHKPDSDF
jgi:hypothetical protein